MKQVAYNPIRDRKCNLETFTEKKINSTKQFVRGINCSF